MPKCILFAFLASILFQNCRKEVFTSDPNQLPRYSTDSLRFDTVFTSLGSATRLFKIYNPHDKFLKIDRAYILNGESSFFRVNIDGVSGSDIRNIEIGPNDSIYVFCEVTVDPNLPLSLSPFIIIDSLVFEVNKIKQRVVLEAWGQDANYFPSKENKAQIAFYDLQGQTLILDDPKPYVFYGIVYFDNGKLEIPAGTNIYVYGGITKSQDQEGNSFFYNDGRIYIGPQASIEVKGTKFLPVTFQGVRLEEEFKEVPGQWSGIVLDKLSKGNRFNYATIKNNLIGILVDSMAEVFIENCIFSNNSITGITAIAATVELNNSLFYNQGQQSFAAINGGNYILNYSSFANFGNQSSAVSLTTYRCIDPPFCSILYNSDLNAKLTNCIITGSDEDEFYMDSLSGVSFDVQLSHCLFRVKDILKATQFPNFISNNTTDCIHSKSFNKLFKDISKNDFHLDTLSQVEMKAIPIPTILLDLDGNTRDALLPDMGCYEYK